jgi:hypothetical protein
MERISGSETSGIRAQWCPRLISINAAATV